MKRRLFFLIFILLSLGILSCNISGQVPQTVPSNVPAQATQDAPFPTPFALDEILASGQISASEDDLCPQESFYRSLPEDFHVTGWAQEMEHPPITQGGAIGGISLSDGTAIGLNTFVVPEEQTITVTVRYAYWGSGPQDTLPLPMRFILLADEQQTTTSFNGSVQPYYDILFQPGEEGAITFDVSPLQPGIHDFNLVGIANVDKEPDYTEMGMLSYRFTLVAGGERSVTPRPYLFFDATDTYQPGESGLSISLSLDKDQVLDWNYPNPILPVRAGQFLDFYVYAGYLSAINGDYPDEPEADQQPFALVLFEDYLQNEFSDETPVVYGIVSLGTSYARIPVHLQSPQEPGLHQIIAARIPYPGFPVCLLNGGGEGKNARTYSYGLFLNRVGINIVP